MANTFELISAVTVGAGGAANITFSSIPSTYTDLQLVMSLRCTRAVEFTQVGVRVNASSSAYGTNRWLQGDGAAASSSTSTAQYLCYGSIWVSGANATASSFTSTQLYIPNYSGSADKSASVDSVGEQNTATGYQGLVAGIWNNSSAISSIALTEPNGSTNFVQYSTAYLYGVKNA